MKSSILILLSVVILFVVMVHAERTLYHAQGHQGPHSYKFGYDTGPGQGYNRQFRHEERDDYGVVHGKYGYFDKYGKPIVVHYRAHPYYGFEVLKNGKYR